MAEQPSAGAVSAAFPTPPPFYKHFTTENLSHLQEIQTSTISPSEEPPKLEIAQSPPSVDLDALPLELRYLIPPLPPTGQYRSFNALQDASSPEPSSSAPDPQRLKTITRSLLLQFLSYSHILATNPDDYPPKWDEIRAVFVEAHNVINEYRPHQARETLIQMMEEQINKGREEIKICRETEEKVKEALGDLGKGLEFQDLDAGKKRKRERERDKAGEEKRIWEMLEREVGKV